MTRVRNGLLLSGLTLTVALLRAPDARADVARSVAAGGFHTCALTTGGKVLCWGLNSHGALGDGTNSDRWSPVPVVGLTPGVVQLAVGLWHTCALTTEGAVWCWGLNSSGQLGDGSGIDRLAPVPVSVLTSGVVAIAAGDAHTCALTTSGAVQCWGANNLGQIGDGTTTDFRLVPTAVSGLTSGITTLAAGGDHACAASSAGTVACWGGGDAPVRYTPVAVSGLPAGITHLAAGSYHTCALSGAGAVFCWGHNSFGQLGDGTNTDHAAAVGATGLGAGVVAIAAGQLSNCAVTSGGAAVCWGNNSFGQLGDGTWTTRWSYVGVSGLQGGATSVAAGWSHSCALTSRGGIRCWGNNRFGQLGTGTTTGLGAAELTPLPVTGLAPATADDFDGDGRGDLAVFRPSAGAWLVVRSRSSSSAGTTWGAAGDVPVPGDYDGDGVSDMAVFRPSSGAWYIVRSRTGSATGTLWGAPDDIPVPADYDGDGMSDVGVFRPATGAWFLINSETGAGVLNRRWGGPGDIPVPADYDGDGKADVAVFRPSAGAWYVVRSHDGVGMGVMWGKAGDIPVTADFDGDGKADIAVFRPTSSAWYIIKSTGGAQGFLWGTVGDIPVVRDYDGDGKADIAVFRESTGAWYIILSRTGTGIGVLWGTVGDKPV